MKNPRTRVHNILLAAAMAWPLIASAGADDMGGDAGHPAMTHAAPDRDGQHGPGRQGPEHGDAGPGFRGGPGMGGRPPFLHGVELSEAQQDQVFAILHAEQPYLREQGKAAAKAHEALRALGRADKYDDAKAAALAKEAATAMANIALQHVRTEQKLLAVLTPEQRTKQAEGIARHAPRP
ncbi:Spy/CpxP family protein refolding chaperone [Duganella sp. HH101]|uniref:Spy/CpxP family protein refolding chaperone n=1 Tax=Duganella sp. HH101 TaxID=1781066 RepID=UPI0008755C0E|nr:periplasmic heavy metal sensor [Duganella sp. HH101]OFA00846.1 periplasmic protein [Duganella sp. HH101]